MIAQLTLHYYTTPDERFAAWLETPDGAEVLRLFVTNALLLQARGFRHYGAKAIIEAMRFDYALALGPDADGFKLNNNMTSRLVREAIRRSPALDGFFELRELRP